MMEAENVLETSLQIFPNEIWLEIVSKITSYEELIKLRSVSKDIKVVADEVLKLNSSMWNWKPTFDENFGSFADEVKGTRLTNVEKIINFLDQMKDADWNPFPNGTLIFVPDQYKKCLEDNDEDDKLEGEEKQAVDAFYDSFPKLVDKFSEDITSLVFCFKDDADDDEISREFENILKLKKLKNLAVLSVLDRFNRNEEIEEEEQDALQAYLEEDAEVKKSWEKTRLLIPKLNGVKELMIFGRHCEKGILISVPSCIRALCAAVCGSLQRLQFCSIDSAALTTVNEAGQTIPLVTFPNLKCLKLMGTLNYDHEVDIFVNGLIPSTLQEFSFKYTNYWIDEDVDFLSGGLRFVLENIERQAKNLKLFHVHLRDGLLEVPVDTEMEEDEDQLTFPKTTHLILTYATLNKWKNTISYSKEKFPNLKQLTIIDDNEEPIDPNHLRVFVERLWAKLPGSVELIHIPRYFWSARRDGPVTLNFGRFSKY